MRSFDPRMLTKDAIEKNTCTCVDALATHCWEQILAERAFKQALGDLETHASSNTDEIIETLVRAYEEYGISSGPQHARQLIRGIEAAAASQAREARGPSASR